MIARGFAGAAAVAAVALAAPHAARAGPVSGVCSSDVGSAPVTRRWPAPLDRTVALHARNLALRDALSRLATAAGIDLSYSSDLLPLDRTVCVSRDGVAAGDVLLELLGDAPVEPVVAAGDRVVLVPVPRRAAAPRTGSVSLLDRVLVTGDRDDVPDRARTVAAQSVDGRRLVAQGTGTLSDALDGGAAGIWVWQQSPTSLLASYGSVRGASSFGLSYPKVYIDGIAVANPLLVTQLVPETVDHIEVMRGPQEAALFGADAISGVVNIVTRHGGVGPDGERATVRSSAGIANSAFATHPVLVQNHTLSLRAGDELRSAGITVGLGTIGQFVPGAYSRELNVGGDARLVGSRTSLTGTVRFYGKDARIPTSPLLGAPGGGTAAAAPSDVGGLLGDRSDTTAQSVRQYTIGASATYAGDARWSSAVVAGIDGYRLAGEGAAYAPLSPLDSALRAARGGADRATLRISSVARFGARERLAGTVSVGLEQSIIREQTSAWSRPTPIDAGNQRALALWRSNTGLTTQGSASWRDALFVTGGARLERNDVYAGLAQVAALPMLGAAVVHDVGPVTAKLRGAYGRGIRTAQTSPREIALVGAARVLSLSVPAEEQSGIEGGLDLLIGGRFSLHATRFDQRAFGLIQPVAIAPDSGARPFDLVLRNVGAITNRGWELQSAITAGRLSVDGTLSLVDSRVQRTASDYLGELRAGDHMLGVPARTVGLGASWAGLRWSGSIGASRAADWTDYDRLALARDLSATASAGAATPARLRGYWRHYGGVTRLRASFSRDLRGGIGLRLTGENLLDQQRGEPDNLTVLPGRTVTLGLTASF